MTSAQVQRIIAREMKRAYALATKLQRRAETRRRDLWRRRVLASLDEAKRRGVTDGAQLRAWLAATVGQTLPLP